MMFEVSRALYRRLWPMVEPGDCVAARVTLVEAAETAIARIEDGPERAERVARWLFGEVRYLFPLSRQAAVRRCVDEGCRMAAREALHRTHERLDFLGQPRRCPELTRRGTPCQREPLS